MRGKTLRQQIKLLRDKGNAVPQVIRILKEEGYTDKLLCALLADEEETLKDGFVIINNPGIKFHIKFETWLRIEIENIMLEDEDD